MSYTPTNWQTGDTITAEKLNNMESGIEANTPLIINFHESEDMSMYLTTSEVLGYVAAISNKKIFYVSFNGSEAFPAHTIANGIEAHLENIPALAIFDESDSGVFRFNWDATPYDGKVFGQFFSDTFIVTLTPTSPDYSGTMDKTVAEIQTAYDSGSEIVFRTMISATTHVDVPMSFASELGFAFKDFGATIILPSQNVMIAAETLATDNGTKQTYETTIYPLTPMS